MASTLRADHVPLIHALLDAVGDDAAFGQALTGLCTPFGAVGNDAYVIRKADAAVVNRMTYVRDPAISLFDDYERRWRAVDPRFQTAMRRPDVVHSDVAVVDPAEFERSGLYNETLMPAGIRYALFGSFSISSELVFATALCRAKAAGAFQGDDIGMLADLVPSVGRAVRLHELVRTLGEESRDLRATLDRMPAAVAIVGPGGRVRAANAAASALLSRGDGLRTQGGVLTAMFPSDARRLAISLAAALVEANPRRRRSAPLSAPGVRIRRERGAPLDVVFLPLGARREYGSSDHVMAVFYDPDRVLTLDVEVVAAWHGLTATEAEIAAALAMGKTLTNVAAERGCSEHTLRTHLKRIFSKTGLTRQADLVRTLLTGPAIHPRT